MDARPHPYPNDVQVFNKNGGFTIDHSSLKGGSTKVRFGWLQGVVFSPPIDINNHATPGLGATFIEDDITKGYDNMEISDFSYVHVPLMPFYHCDRDIPKECFGGGTWIVWSGVSEQKPNPSNNGMSQKATRAIQTGGRSTGVQTYTTNSYGNNKIYSCEGWLTRPKGYAKPFEDWPPQPPPYANYVDHWPGSHMTLMAVADFDSRSVNIMASSVVGNFPGAGGSLYGDQDIDDIYPDWYGDGRSWNLIPIIASVRDGTYIVKWVWDGADTGSRRMFTQLSAGGAIAIGGATNLSDAKRDLYTDLRSGSVAANGNFWSYHCGLEGPRDSFLEPVEHISAELYLDDYFSIGQVMPGEILTGNTMQYSDNGFHYCWVREDWETGQPMGDRGSYRIWEAPNNGGQFEPVFPSTIKRVGYFEAPPFGLHHSAGLQIASEEEV